MDPRQLTDNELARALDFCNEDLRRAAPAIPTQLIARQMELHREHQQRLHGKVA